MAAAGFRKKDQRDQLRINPIVPKTESVKRFPNTLHHVLKYLRVNLLPVKSVSQHPVVLAAQHIKPALHLAPLLIGWLNPVLVGDSHDIL